MRFYRLVKNDIKNGFASNYLHYAAVIAVVLVSCIELSVRVRNRYYFDEVLPQITLADMLLYLMCGAPKAVPGQTGGFIFPDRWFLLQMVLLYGGLYFPYRDLHTLGVNVLVRSGNRGRWWQSKCVWLVFDQAVSYSCIYIIIVLFGIVTGKVFSLEITPMLVNDIMYAGSPYDGFPFQSILMILTLPFLTTVALAIWQNVLSMFLKPIFSYLAMAVAALVSAYFMNSLLIGNFAMPIRSKYFIPDGYDPSYGYLIVVLTAFAGVIAGMLRLKKYDIFSAEH